MALTKEQWDEVSGALSKLRGLGCAVCVFTPDDVESAIENDDQESDEEEGDKAPVTPKRAAEWLENNRKYLEDTMSTNGNMFIADNVDEIRGGE